MSINSYYSRRQQLASVFEDTMERIKQSLDFTNATNFSIHNQQFIPESAIISISDVPKADKPANIIVSRLRSFEAAAQYIGKRTAVLNFASATNPGGGVEKGASAQEECLCRVSTLYPCLADQKMRTSFYTPHRKNGNTLHNDDIIYTPNVLVIKDDDHNLLSEPFSVDIISCAAPNLRERPSNQYNTGDTIKVQISDNELLALHEKRARKIFSSAIANGVEILILGAFGCGAFQNNPHIVAQAYKNVLPDFAHYFHTIEFAIYCRPADSINYDAFKSTILNS
jgi:uncharacterized protein (TIGR02452 family)